MDIIIDGCTLIVRDRVSGEIHTFTYETAEFALLVADATAAA